MSPTLAQIKLKNFQNSKIYEEGTEKKEMEYPAYTIIYTKYELILSELLYKHLFNKVKDESIWHMPHKKRYIFTPINKIHIGNSKIFDDDTNHLENFINFVTFGEYKKELKEIHHSYIIIETTDGDLLIEKDGKEIVVKNGIRNDYYENTKIIDTNNKPNFCLYSLLCNTIDTYDSTEGFFNYDLVTNNCQHFIAKILDSNGIEGAYDYVRQDEYYDKFKQSKFAGFFNYFIRITHKP
jgi:hypothetical protein